ncbi:MAG: hypothetical protein ACRDAM_02625 [Casimicrobium sp.]
MNKVFSSSFCRLTLVVVAAVALPSWAADKNAPIPAPELAPQLPSRDNARVTQKDAKAPAADEDVKKSVSEDVVEERVESRLAVIRSGNYVVADPNVGRYDRAASNGQRRVAPSMWQIFKF